MVSSLGVITKHLYGKLIASAYGRHSPPIIDTYSFPYDYIRSPLFVVKVIDQSMNDTKIASLRYNYFNPVVHKQGLGFRGFHWITTEDKLRNTSQTRYYDPYHFGVVKEEHSPMAKNTYTWSVSVASNKITKVQLTNLSSQDKLKNTTVTSSYTYDTYGNPLTETVNYGGGITETIANSYCNSTNENGYLLGYLTQRTKTVNRNGSTCSERYYVQSYTDKGDPCLVIQYINENQTSSEYFDYNWPGVLARKAVANYSSANKIITNYEYDSYGRLKKETDPLGLSTTYEYSSTTGLLSLSKDHKNQQITYDYDAFGRNNGITYPDGTYKNTSYSWDAKGTNGLYCKYDFHLGKPWVKTYYDALGRETASTGLNFDYSEPRMDKLYDDYGRLWKVSLPFRKMNAFYWTTYQYDNYDRPTSIVEASGRKTLYSYSGNSVTTKKEEISSTQTFDTQGNLISVTDPAGTITHSLRPDGQPSSITAPDGAITSFTYDGYGRRLTIVDPSAGTQTRTYDSSGNIASETDADNNTISYGYDAYNRLVKKTRREFNTTYAYNTDGLLASEISTNGTSKNWNYDTYGRISKAKETAVDGKWLEKTHSYAHGYRISTLFTSQSGNIVTENYHHEAGHLTEIKLNGNVSIWKMTGMSASGQPTSVTTGNFTRSYNYNIYDLPTGRPAGSFQNFIYNFNAAKGNLTFRRDNKRNIEENFTYDNLNRLTGYAGKTAEYEINGNIYEKSDVGTFYYYRARPYAIFEVEPHNSAIPLRNQSVTYTSFKRPASITEGAYAAALTYNGSSKRVKMELKKNGYKELTRHSISDCYEIDDRAVGGIKEKLYLGGNFYSAPAVYVKDNGGNWNIYYLCRDYLGSITRFL
jgi:YD repeat-containing protein